MAKTIELNPLKAEALPDLFLQISMRAEDQQSAEKALAEIQRRYQNFLYTIIRRACSSWKQYGEDLIISTYSNTLLALYLKADKFIEIDDLDESNQERRFKGWLAKVAQTELLMLLRELRNDNIEYIEDDSFLSIEDKKNEELPSQNILLIEDALKTLKERDRDILVTYMMFQDGRKQLPKEEMERLTEIWETTPDNARQIRRRAFMKVESFVKTQNKIEK
ncbi:MAG: hypothetical protein GQ574_28825 [Crocinitomix sp.]|nr:hypothetical protein [Crocinitomix sp.]